MYNPVYPSVPGRTIIGSKDPNKLLQGSASDDLLISELVADTLIGGAGADIFTFNWNGGSRGQAGVPVLADFEVSKDKIDLDSWFAVVEPSGRTVTSLIKYDFIGTATQFSKPSINGNPQAIFDPSSRMLIIDSDRDGLVSSADYKISLPGVASLDQSNFVHTTWFESTADYTIFYGNSDNETAIGNDGKDNFFGGKGDDVLLGGGGDDYISGNEGADTLYGWNDADVVVGGNGDDRIVGGRGADTMEGGGGSDVYAFSEINDVRSTTSSSIDLVNQFISGEDKLDFRNFDIDATSNVQTRTFSFGAGGPGGSARLVYDAANWQLKGDVDGNGSYEFAIRIYATSPLTADDLILSNKTLQGGATGDALSGGNGDDILTGGGGSDHLIGGYGADTFVFKSIDDFRSPTGAAVIDFVDDFASGVDKLDFRNFDIATGSAVTTRQFTFIGNNQAFRKDGSAQLMFSGSAGKLYGDTNGDGAADFTVQMQGVNSLSARDLILA